MTHWTLQAKIYTNAKGEKTNMPAYGDHAYATKRAPLTSTASELHKPAAQLVELVQRLASRVYDLIPLPIATMPSVKKVPKKQPVPAEYVKSVVKCSVMLCITRNVSLSNLSNQAIKSAFSREALSSRQPAALQLMLVHALLKYADVIIFLCKINPQQVCWQKVYSLHRVCRSNAGLRRSSSVGATSCRRRG